MHRSSVFSHPSIVRAFPFPPRPLPNTGLNRPSLKSKKFQGIVIRFFVVRDRPGRAKSAPVCLGSIGGCYKGSQHLKARLGKPARGLKGESMRIGKNRITVVAVIALLVLVGGVTPLLAQISFSPNFSTAVAGTNVNLNGSAALINGNTVLQLTPAAQSQAGSAWFSTQQVVKGGFSTTFTFQIGGRSPDSIGDADGIAFVVQSVSATAVGPLGCGIGFGGSANCTPGTGITNSLAVEFDTWSNDQTDLFSHNHVAIQSCLTAANDTNVDPNNATDHTRCTIANNASLPSLLANNLPHIATVTYVPPSGSTPGSMDVILDGIDLFPNASAHIDLTNLTLSDGSNCTACAAFVDLLHRPAAATTIRTS